MLDFIVAVLLIVLGFILFRNYLIPILKEEIKQAKTRTKNIDLKYETLKLEKEKLELEIKKMKG